MNILSESKDRLNLAYWLMGLFSFLQIIYISTCIFFTTRFLLSGNQAYSFIENVSVIPIAYTKRPVYALLGFMLLLIAMKLRSLLEENIRNVLFVLILEITICLFLMWTISFASNTILLFVIVNMMSMTRKKGNKGISLLIMVILFISTNYDIVSIFFPVAGFVEYLSVYSAQAKSLFALVNSVMTTSCIVLFILYMLFLIQDQLSESRRIQLLNLELKDLNEQLKEYADVREKMGETKERNRLAREIHDTLGHTLTGLSTGLEACQTIMDINPELAKKQLGVLSNVAKDGLKDVRRSVKKLRPDALENHTLKEALVSMIDEFKKTTGVQVHFVCHLTSLHFQPDEEEAIYRIIQEGTTNAVRHGKANEIYISFGMDQNTLILIVEDNGIGCVNVHEGFGLHHMKERVELLNGKVRCYGTDGFVLIVELPLREEKGND